MIPFCVSWAWHDGLVALGDVLAPGLLLGGQPGGFGAPGRRGAPGNAAGWRAQPIEDGALDHRAFAPVDDLQNAQARRHHEMDLGTFGSRLGRDPDVLAGAAQRRPGLCVGAGFV